jgi:tRNA pseudouridine13 synthase
MGDIAKKHETGGLFIVEDPEIEQTRYLSKEISFTAPIFGYKMMQPKNRAYEMEKSILEETGFDHSRSWIKNKVKGTRRFGRLIPEITLEKSNEHICMNFYLPKGGFATTLIREFTKKN